MGPSSRCVFPTLYCTAVLVATMVSDAAAEPARTRALTASLQQQGVATDRILGTDPRGVPIVCGTLAPTGSWTLRPHPATPTTAVTAREWATIPGIIRADGSEAFRLEVDVGGPVAAVTLDNVALSLVAPAPVPLELRDDGSGVDQVAGDFIFSTGPFRFDTSFAEPGFYYGDPTSPDGIGVVDVGTINIEELDTSISQFLLPPVVGLLRSDLPAASSVQLAPDVIVTPHVINVRTTAQETQRFLRGLGGVPANLTNLIYAVLPDDFDFFMLFSTRKIEQLPRLDALNFVAGRHLSAQIDYTGTGQGAFDLTEFYGSGGRLLGVNALDAYDRGIMSNNAMHEIVHQWAAFLDHSLDLNGDSAHYSSWSSAGSMVGGFSWQENQDGTFSIDCDEGRNGGSRASPLDRYLSGAIPPSQVPPLRVLDNAIPILTKCEGEPVGPKEIIRTITINDIRAIEGNRVPRPGGAQRNFSLAFVAESHGRLLNPTELTYYDVLARHYTKDPGAGQPAPYLGFNWAPLTRYFQGTTWTSAVLRDLDDSAGETEIRTLPLIFLTALAFILVSMGVIHQRRASR